MNNLGKEQKLSKLPNEIENIWRRQMSRVCQVTGRGPMSGNNVSHANNKTRRRFQLNLHDRRFYVDSLKRKVKLRVSNKGLRIIDKLGIEKVIEMLKERGEKF